MQPVFRVVSNNSENSAQKGGPYIYCVNCLRKLGKWRTKGSDPFANKMNDIKFILDRIHRGWNINCYQYDTAGQPLYYVGYEYHGKALMEPDLEVRSALLDKCHAQKAPAVLTGEQMIYYMAFQDETDHLYVFGPASTEVLSFSQLHSYRYRHHIAEKEYRIPCVSVSKALTCLAVAYYMVTGRTMEETDILRKNQQLEQPDEREIFEYQLDQNLQEKGHMAYVEEQKWLYSIESGTAVTEFDFVPQEVEKAERVGVLAQNDELKQTEYMVISAICLATRAAIRGGVSAAEAYSLSEAYYQKIAKCRNSMDILNLYQRAATDFTNRVQKNREKGRSADYIEQCKDYITTHYHQKFTMEELANRLGLNRSYLSRKFTEEVGMTMNQYLIKKRLEAAANMLKYSDTKISQISDYLCFNSQSHFGDMFRRQYGMTPLEYRKKNKIIDFMSDGK